MKRLLLLIFFTTVITSCYSTRGSGQREKAFIDPQVQFWLLKEHKAGQEKLAVLVRAYAPLDYVFLTRISKGFYTGRVTKEQLKKLIRDERVMRIRTGKKKLNKSQGA